MEAAQEATMEATCEASEDRKGTVVVLREEDELKLVAFRKGNELLYNKRLMDYEDPTRKVV